MKGVTIQRFKGSEVQGLEVQGLEVQGSAQPPAQQTAGQIEKET